MYTVILAYNYIGVEVTSGSIAAVAGGVVGGVFVVALIVMVLIVLLVSLVNKGKREGQLHKT